MYHVRIKLRLQAGQAIRERLAQQNICIRCSKRVVENTLNLRMKAQQQDLACPAINNFGQADVVWRAKTATFGVYFLGRSNARIDVILEDGLL